MSSSRTREALDRKREELRQLSLKLKEQKTKEERIAKAKARAEEKRRHLLFGQSLASALQLRQVDPDVVKGWLDQAVSRDDDRVFLGLTVTHSHSASI